MWFGLFPLGTTLVVSVGKRLDWFFFVYLCLKHSGSIVYMKSCLSIQASVPTFFDILDKKKKEKKKNSNFLCLA